MNAFVVNPRPIQQGQQILSTKTGGLSGQGLDPLRERDPHCFVREDGKK